MKIAIIGTRGIPNNYGGFEQFAEYLSEGLTKLGSDVYVYNSHRHPWQQKKWKEVNILHKFDPEFIIGTAGQFIYDLNCILNCRKHKFDIILQLGYTSSSVWSFLFPSKSIIVTNMDGLEWKRSKYSKPVQKFLRYAEKLAVKKSDFLIADSTGIQNYLQQTYKVSSRYIPYGANVFHHPESALLSQFGLSPFSYHMLVARLEPENSIEIILGGFMKSDKKKDMLVVANTNSTYGKFLLHKFSGEEKIKFIGTVFDIKILNSLRYFSNLYFHGHTVGGTNPSLLEAMASSALIAAHKNEFNSAVLGSDAYYFENEEQVSSLMRSISKNESEERKIAANILKIENLYSWPKIIADYASFFSEKI